MAANFCWRDNPDSNSDRCRRAALDYLEKAESVKKETFRSALWYGLGLPRLTLAYRSELLFTMTVISLVLQLGYSVAETYPANIVKPMGLKWLTALLAAFQLFGHLTLFMLSRDPKRYTKYSKICTVFLGGIAAVGKFLECYLICRCVDKQMPADHAAKFCLVALSLAQGLATIVTGIAHSRHEPIIFDRPGEIFFGFGYRCYFPRLNTEEKRTLLAAIIRSKC
jgi:hypothetical protein